MNSVLVCILLAYCMAMLLFYFGFFNLTKTTPLLNAREKINFSVVIPFRNEAAVLPELLQSISTLQYDTSLLEFIFVDDASEDQSYDIVNAFVGESPYTIKLISSQRQSNSPKKDAIVTAIAKAAFDWIVTIDADCTFGPYWLKALDAHIQKHQTDFVAGSVSFSGPQSFMHQFQILESLSLHSTTVGSFGLHKPMLCNGANLAYKKSLFENVRGFQGNDHLASGDDMFLMQKAAQMGYHLSFLKSKEAVVETKTVSSWKALIMQRKRWASKTSAYQSFYTKAFAWIVFLGNLSLIVALICKWFDLISLSDLIMLCLSKFIVDTLLIMVSALYLNKSRALIWLLPALFFYPFWVLFIAFATLNKSYTWKGRHLR